LTGILKPFQTPYGFSIPGAIWVVSSFSASKRPLHVEYHLSCYASESDYLVESTALAYRRYEDSDLLALSVVEYGNANVPGGLFGAVSELLIADAIGRLDDVEFYDPQSGEPPVLRNFFYDGVLVTINENIQVVSLVG
jgi:hypothetical protein